MSIKAAPQPKTSSTPVPTVQAPTVLGQTRGFTDTIETPELENSNFDLQQAAAAPPPPNTKQTNESSYDFSLISISDYIPAPVQTKLVVGAPGDKYEQEADRMADKVVSMKSPVQKQPESTPDEEEIQTKPVAETIQRQTEEDGTVHLKPVAETIQRQTEEDGTVHLKPLAETIQRQTEEDGTVHLKPLAETIQRQTEEDGTVHLKPLANQISPLIQQTIKESHAIARKGEGAFTASESIETRLHSQQGSGESLPEETREFMESRFDNDFSDVKIHKGSQAVQLSQELGAQAFTHGQDIYFNSGKYEPHTDTGKRLLAHELTHTIQQTGPKIKTKSLKSSEKPNKIQRQLQATLSQQISAVDSQETKAQREAETAADSKADERQQQIEADKENAKKELQADSKNDENAELKKYVAEEAGKKADTQAQSLKQESETVKGQANAGQNAQEFEAKAQQKVESQEKQDQQEVSEKVAGKAEEANEQAEADKKAPAAGGGEEIPAGEIPATEAGGSDGKDEALVEADATVDASIGGGEVVADESRETVPEVKGEKAPASPDEDPAFQATIKQSEQQAKQQSAHKAAATKAKEAQAAAEDPAQQMRQAQATQTGETAAKETKAFNREAFEAALLEKLEFIKPKNQEEADKFANSGKADELKGPLNQQVAAGKQQAGGGLPETAAAPPKPDAETPKQVEDVPAPAEEVGEVPAEIEAEKAVPQEKTEKEIEEPLKQTAENLETTFGPIQTKLVVGAPGDRYEQEADRMADRVMAMPDEAALSQTATAASEQLQMTPEIDIQRREEVQPEKAEQPDAEVPMNTERLATWEEVGGGEALKALKDAKQHATKEGPQQFRKGEQETLTAAKADATATAQQSNQQMYSDRTAAMQEVATSQTQAKTQDEGERAQVSANIQQIFAQTQQNVNKILGQMDQDVNAEFEAGVKRAKEKFERYQSSQMEAYKRRRYYKTIEIKIPVPKLWGIKMKKVGEMSIFDPITWLRDKFKGMPDEVNKFYEEGRQLFVEELKQSISRIAGIVESGLNTAKAEVDKGRQQVSDYVQSLPENLKEVGTQAALDVQEKFDNLEQSIKDKQNELVDSLAGKYQASLQELDKRIDELKSENKGLIDKALKFVADLAKGVIKTLLWPIKKVLDALIGDMAGKVIDAIIDDPIRFMKNLFKGIGDGLQKFVSNIGKHLINGLVTWLFGNLGEIKLPEKFDLKGFLDILLQILGLTKDYIFGLAEKFFGADIVNVIRFISENGIGFLTNLGKGEKAEAAEEASEEEAADVQMQAEEETASGGGPAEEAKELIANLNPGAKFVFDFFIAIIKDGVSGVWEFIKSSLGQIKEMLMSELTQMIIIELVKQGVIWLISMLNPASGLVKIAKAIYDVINFFVERKDEIMALVTAILNTLKAIIEGNVGAMAQAIENALAQAIPTILGFLASLLGIGGIPSKIKTIFKKLRAPVDKIVGGFFEKASGFFKGGKKKAKAKPKKNKGKSVTNTKGKAKPTQKPKQVKSGQKNKLKPNKAKPKKDKKEKPKKPEKSTKEKTKDFLKQVGSEMGESLKSDLLDPENQPETEAESTDTTDNAEESTETDNEETADAVQRKIQTIKTEEKGFNFSQVPVQSKAESNTPNSNLFCRQTTAASLNSTSNQNPTRELTPVMPRLSESPTSTTVNPLLSNYIQQRASEQLPHFVQLETEADETTNKLQLKAR